MGGLLSKKDETTTHIDKNLTKDRKKKEKEIKLLLLGTGESGKSTFAKQLKILHLAGFTKEELTHYKGVLHSNVLAGISTLIEMAPKLGYTIDAGLNDKLPQFLDPNIANLMVTPTMASNIKLIWDDKAIQEAYERRAEFQLHGSVPYIVEHIDRLSQPDCELNHDDVLQCRIRTTGIVEIEFSLENCHFRVMDVGGQRSERRKWIHCFDDVTAVIFCVALSEYDEVLVEDNRVNRMHEALELFTEVLANKVFTNSSIILFLNKSDLFREKIKKVQLSKYFPEYKGPNDFDTGSKFISSKFTEKNKDKNRIVFPHVTCATDTENVRVVFDTVRAGIINSALKDLAI